MVAFDPLAIYRGERGLDISAKRRYAPELILDVIYGTGSNITINQIKKNNDRQAALSGSGPGRTTR
ncbi:MAG: hypothetical protein Q8P33_03470 [bacterium]|nr:hypothetical protein [bacterium]